MSNRETLIAAVKTRVDGVTGVTAYRSRQQPLSTTQNLCIVVEPRTESVEVLDVHGNTERTLSVAISLLVRGAVPDQIADTTVAGIETAMAAAFSGAIGHMLTSIDWQMEDADQMGVAAITLSYQFIYQC